jgi:hypothetical protein
LSSADLSFPQLEVATDPERMREVFQEQLRPLGGKVYRVLECRISFIRQTASRCLLHYTLRLGDSGTEHEWSQLVTGVMYGGNRTRRTWEKLRRSDPGPAIPDASPALAPFSYVPDLDMLVQVFPYDHRLPGLHLLMSGPPPELQALLLARFGPGDWRVEAWDIEPVRYRVDMRATLQLTARARDATTGRAEERGFYAKVYRKEEQGEQTYQALRELWGKAGAGGESFTVPRPIAYLGGLRTLLQEEAPGISLLSILRRKEEEAMPAVRKVARALATFHLGDVVTPRRRRRLGGEIARLQSAGRDLRSACPHLGPEIEEIVGAVVVGLEEVPPAPTHGDLKPADILLDGDRLVLLDFDKLAGADPVLDVANFLIHLAKARPSSPIPHDRRRAVARAFTEEYFARAPQTWRARLPFHYAMTVLNRAAGLYRSQVPSWPDRIEARLKEAKDSLAGRVW